MALKDDTIPKALVRNFERWGDRKVAMRSKKYGLWQEYTWKDCYDRVKWVSLGLLSLGFQRGEKVCIIGDNGPEWFWAEYGILSAGGVATGVFVDCVPEEIKYQATHSDATFIFARDQEQVDKIIKFWEEVPLVRKIIYWDSKGMWGYHQPFIMSFEDLLTEGRKYEALHPEAFPENVNQGRDEDLMVFCYTSGTTGLPKAAMLSYRNIVSRVERLFDIDPWYPTDNYVSMYSPAWITEQCFGVAAPILSGATANFPEMPDTIQEDLREIGPQFVLYTSRIWEGMARTIQAKIWDTGPLKRLLYKAFLALNDKILDRELQGKKVWGSKALLFLSDLLVMRPLRDKIGLSKIRSCYTGGSVTSPDAFRFFRTIGLEIKQAYGTSEAPLITLHRTGDVDLETIGPPVPGYELKITKDFELLVKGEGVFLGYYKDPQATRKAMELGWYRSGDACQFDKKGHVIYMDRVSDLIELGDGEKFSPQYIEGKLKFSPYIRDCFVVSSQPGGNGEHYVVAIIQIDFENTSRWAERGHINYTTYADLSQKTEVYGLIDTEMGRVNQTLPLSARVKKFVLLNKELDPDEAELTRTRKLRRDFVQKKYDKILNEIYRGSREISVELEVKYQDGRMGRIATPLRIWTPKDEKG